MKLTRRLRLLRNRLRPVLCAFGLHRWQYLLAPPSWQRGDKYAPGVWCIFCGEDW